MELPDQLNIESLVNRVQKEKTEEIIFALNPNIQGDTTIYYIQKKLQAFDRKSGSAGMPRPISHQIVKRRPADAKHFSRSMHVSVGPP